MNTLTAVAHLHELAANSNVLKKSKQKKTLELSQIFPTNTNVSD
jgi:hypothetical protein